MLGEIIWHFKLFDFNAEINEKSLSNNRYTGFGKLTKKDCWKYEGEFVNNKYHGKGLLTHKFNN